jgi:hypothetical protein
MTGLPLFGMLFNDEKPADFRAEDFFAVSL